MRAPRRAWRAVGATAAVGAGCNGEHNSLAPDGTEAHRIAGVGWFMIVVAAAVAVVFLGALAVALWRGGRPRPRRASEESLVVAGGVALPLVVIAALSALTLNVLDDQRHGGTVHVEVTGRQFWWEARYTDDGFVTANELEIPVGVDVDLTLRSADVIHSFWAPDLAGKIDMVPGKENHLVVHATRAGTYRGQCAEFCGLQHAEMAFVVRAVPSADFDAWAAGMAAPAAAAATGEQRAGRDAFEALPCAGCHTIRGTGAHGDVGPDLTHLASRAFIGAGAADNTAATLAAWISDSQAIKPGNLMPPIALTPEQLRTVVAYLEHLR